MTTKRARTAVAAVLLTGSLAGGLLATAAPALAAPDVASAAGSTTPVAGSAATSRQVVAAWYARFLDARFPIGRYPGSGYWIDRLDRGDDPASVLADLLTTREHASEAVTAIYAAYLDRTPDTGASCWIDGVASGAFPIERVEQNVAASDEYLLRTSTGARAGRSGGNASERPSPRASSRTTATSWGAAPSRARWRTGTAARSPATRRWSPRSAPALSTPTAPAERAQPVRCPTRRPVTNAPRRSRPSSRRSREAA